MGIFLRELRGLWRKADPPFSPLVFMAARNLRLVGEEGTALSGLEKLGLLWKENRVSRKEFADFEVALLRLAKDWCRRGKCRDCIVKKYCPSANNEL